MPYHPLPAYLGNRPIYRLFTSKPRCIWILAEQRAYRLGGATDPQLHAYLLVSDINVGLEESGGDDVVNVLNGLQAALAHVLALDLIAELESLVDTGGGTRGDGAAEDAC